MRSSRAAESHPPQLRRARGGYLAWLIGIVSDPFYPEGEARIGECGTKAVPLPTQVLDFREQLIHDSVAVLHIDRGGVMIFTRCLRR